ncbi:MAG: hypothetical protein ABR881_23075 [Candidatus Sulfotelmatobacter sp.]
MSFSINESALRKCVLFALIMVVPALAFAQHKTNEPPSRPSAPAPHASAPAHTSAPTHTGGNMQHATTPSHMNPTTHTTTTTGHGTTGAGHGVTAAGHGTATAGHGTTLAGHGTATAGHGTMTAGHGTAVGGHGNMTGAHSNISHSAPGRQVSLRGGGSAHIRPNGQIRSINRNGMHIEHNLHGGRTIVRERNGARIVSTGRHGGYVQRAYVTRGGRSYYSRTYYYHGGYRSGVYRGYYYGGHPYYGYYHPYFYHPAYYGWAYNPWPAPVYYGWGWGGAPWYGYYGGYFAPYPVYPSAAFWLTDYLISANLQAAYAAQAEANAEAAGAANNATPSNDQVASAGPPPAAPSGQVALSPEVKEAIAEEVKAQIAASQAEAGKSGSSGGGQQAASGEVPPALDPARRTFVVSDDLAVVADGQECALTQGDVITRLTDTPDADQKVNVSIASSKKTDCAAGKTVAVSVDDLQEMQNHFQEQIDEGMKTLASKQGTAGLPKAPDTSTVASDVPPPPPDKSAAKTLADQDTEADKTEADVKQEAASSGGGSQ